MKTNDDKHFTTPSTTKFSDCGWKQNICEWFFCHFMFLFFNLLHSFANPHIPEWDEFENIVILIQWQERLFATSFSIKLPSSCAFYLRCFKLQQSPHDKLCWMQNRFVLLIAVICIMIFIQNWASCPDVFDDQIELSLWCFPSLPWVCYNNEWLNHVFSHNLLWNKVATTPRLQQTILDMMWWLRRAFTKFVRSKGVAAIDAWHASCHQKIWQENGAEQHWHGNGHQTLFWTKWCSNRWKETFIVFPQHTSSWLCMSSFVWLHHEQHWVCPWHHWPSHTKHSLILFGCTIFLTSSWSLMKPHQQASLNRFSDKTSRKCFDPSNVCIKFFVFNFMAMQSWLWCLNNVLHGLRTPLSIWWKLVKMCVAIVSCNPSPTISDPCCANLSTTNLPMSMSQCDSKIHSISQIPSSSMHSHNSTTCTHWGPLWFGFISNDWWSMRNEWTGAAHLRHKHFHQQAAAQLLLLCQNLSTVIPTF